RSFVFEPFIRPAEVVERARLLDAVSAAVPVRHASGGDLANPVRARAIARHGAETAAVLVVLALAGGEVALGVGGALAADPALREIERAPGIFALDRPLNGDRRFSVAVQQHVDLDHVLGPHADAAVRDVGAAQRSAVGS